MNKIQSLLNSYPKQQSCDGAGASSLNIKDFYEVLSKAQPHNDQQERRVEKTLKSTSLLLGHLLDLQDAAPSTADSGSTSRTTLTTAELQDELQKVLDTISNVPNLAVDSTDIDEAKLAEFREFKERELLRFNKTIKYIKTLEDLKL